MDLEAVCWFVDVVEQGSFAAAARRLKQPSSNVSRRVSALETEFGVPLLLRTTRSLALTPEGQAFLPLATQLRQERIQLESWADTLRSEPSGRLRITAPSSFARGPLTHWLIRYRAAYPKVDIELIHSNDYLDFQTHQLDFAFRQGPLPDSGLVAQRMFSIEYGVFASPARLAAASDLTHPDQLTTLPIISPGARQQILPWRFKHQVWVPKGATMLFEDMEQCLQAAAAGHGFTYASRYEATPFLRSGELQETLIDHRPEPVGFYLVSPHRQYRSLKSETFLQHVLQERDAFGLADGLVF